MPAQQQLATQLTDATVPVGRQLHIAELLNKEHSEPAKALLTKAAAEPGPQQVLAAQLLCTADDPTPLPLLRGAFAQAGRPPYERLLAAEGMGGCGTRKDASLLAKSLRNGEKSPLLRQAEAGAILRLCSGDPAVLSEQSLTWAPAALTDENWTVRESAVAMLGDVDPQRAVPLLGQAMKDERVEIRQSAAKALGRTKYRGAIAVLSGAMADSNRGVRLDVLRSIGKVSTNLKQRGEAPIDAATQAELQKSLVATADTGDPGEQVMAAATLMRMGDESRRGKLTQALSADDPELKQLAIEEASADPELNKTGLTGLLTDKLFAVRFHAACELAEQGRKDGTDVLREALGKRGVDGFKAYGLLKKLGEPAEPPRDLASLLAVSDPEVRASVVETAMNLPVADAVPVTPVAPAAKAAKAAKAAAPAGAVDDPDAPELDKAAQKQHIKQTLDVTERLLSRGEYDKAIQLLENARRVSPSKTIEMQLEQAYELWSEQESGSKQKALTRKAIDAYKQAKTAAAKEHITELQQRLH